MKKYLSSILIFILFFVVSVNLAHAGNVDYYVSIFSNFGYNSDTVSSTIKDDGSIDLTIKSEDIKENLTVLASEVDNSFFNRIDIKEYKRIFLVCDVEILVNGNKCKTDQVEGNNALVLKDLSLNLIQFNIDSNTLLIVIPSNQFAIPQYRDNLGSYFRALKETYPKNTYSTSLITNVKSNISPFLTETSSYLIAILIFAILFFTVIKGVKDPAVDFEYIKTNVVDFYNKLKSIKGVFLFAFLILLVIYSFILIVLTYKTLGYFSFSYITNYLNNIANLHGLSARESQLMLIYGFVLVVNLCLYLFFDLVSLFNLSLAKFTNTKFNNYIYKWGAVAIVFILLFQTTFKFYNWLFVFLLLCLIYIVVIAYKQKVVFSNLYNKKEKLFIILTFVLLFVFNILTSSYLSSKPINLEYQDLIGDNNKIVMLPYYKDSEPNEYFQDYLVKIDYPLFVDNYLIFDFRFKTINNKNLKDFKADSNYIIVADFSSENFIKFVVQNNNLLSQFKTDKPSALFKVLGNNLYVENGTIDITIDCSKSDIQAETLEMVKVTGKDKLNYNDILYFAGCNGQKQNLIYKLPIKSFTSGDYLRLSGIDINNTTKIVLYDDNNKEVSVENYNVPTGNVYSHVATDSNVVFVYGNSTKNIQFQYDNLNTEINISNPINKLKTGGFIETEFKIWTNKNNTILNYYD